MTIITIRIYPKDTFSHDLVEIYLLYLQNAYTKLWGVGWVEGGS